MVGQRSQAFSLLILQLFLLTHCAGQTLLYPGNATALLDGASYVGALPGCTFTVSLTGGGGAGAGGTTASNGGAGASFPVTFTTSAPFTARVGMGGAYNSAGGGASALYTGAAILAVAGGGGGGAYTGTVLRGNAGPPGGAGSAGSVNGAYPGGGGGTQSAGGAPGSGETCAGGAPAAGTGFTSMSLGGRGGDGGRCTSTVVTAGGSGWGVGGSSRAQVNYDGAGGGGGYYGGGGGSCGCSVSPSGGGGGSSYVNSGAGVTFGTVTYVGGGAMNGAGSAGSVVLLSVSCTPATSSPSTSLTPSKSPSAPPTPSITPSPCPAPPGSYCTAGAILPCPIGAFCAGGAARNTSCHPATACAVPGLASQPPCFWSSTNLAGNHATPGSADATGTAATFSDLMGVASDASANALVTDRSICRLRRVTPAGVVTTIAGGGASGTQCGNVNATGTTALFDGPWGVAVRPSGALFIAEQFKSRLRAVTPAGVVSTVAGGGATGILAGSANGIGADALFNTPNAVAASQLDSALAWVADTDNFKVRRVPIGLLTSTLDPTGSGYTTGISAAPDDTLYVSDFNGRIVKLFPNNTHSVLATGLSSPRGNAYWAPDSVVVAEAGRHRVVLVTPQGTTVLAGGGAFGNLTGSANGYGTAALFPVVWSVAVTPAGAIYVAAGTALRQLTCAPCPAAFFCASGAPAPCPAGSACPLGTLTPTPCAAGTFATGAAANCTQCAPGSHAPAPGAAACAPCPGGHYCPAGTGATARLACGRGNFCPPASAAPRACPLQVPPAGGWGAQGVQGPAFLVETAGCANHCFWNFSAGADGLLSTC